MTTVFSATKVNLRNLTDQELSQVMHDCQTVIRQQRADFEEYELLHTAQGELERRKRQPRSIGRSVLPLTFSELQVA